MTNLKSDLLFYDFYFERMILFRTLRQPSNGSTSNGPHTVTASITAMASVATPAPPEFNVGMNNSESDNSQTDGSPIEEISELKLKSVAKTPEQTSRRG